MSEDDDQVNVDALDYDDGEYDRCECCDAKLDGFAYHCDRCGRQVCAVCIEPGDDATGDVCGLC
jgi:hypothetical protein